MRYQTHENQAALVVINGESFAALPELDAKRSMTALLELGFEATLYFDNEETRDYVESYSTEYATIRAALRATI